MTEILFYHLERRPLEQVLPQLLEKSLERGWRAVVQAGSGERLEALDAALWTWRGDDSFLPHGTAADGHADMQPIFLTSDEANPNSAQVRFLVDGAQASALEAHERVVFLFDGTDEEALTAARGQWSALKGAGHDVTYWQQDENGRWEKKA